ncbi:MAG: hypothetical protein WCH11_02520 [Bdellovibrio sp.]
MEIMCSALEISKSTNGYRFSGVLDERISVKDFQRVIEVRSNPVEFDFNSVSRSSSSGILEWMKFIKLYSGHFYYVNCPVWLINQFNSMSDLLKRGESAVLSFWAPYFCEADESNQYILFRIPKDIPFSGDFKPVPIQEGGKEFAPDFIPSRYLRFIVLNAEGFQEFFAQHHELGGGDG